MLKKKSGSVLESDEEYSVYVFFHANDEKSSRVGERPYHWEKARDTRNKMYALKKAARLHQSPQFEKVIVKRKFFDEKIGHKRGETLKVYEKNKGCLGVTHMQLLRGAIFSAAAVVFVAVLAFLRFVESYF